MVEEPLEAVTTPRAEGTGRSRESSVHPAEAVLKQGSTDAAEPPGGRGERRSKGTTFLEDLPALLPVPPTCQTQV